jgi:hypothetical protein
MRIKGFKKGYIIDYSTKEIAEYLCTNDRPVDIIEKYPDTTPPFYTMIFSRDEFVDPEKHFEAVKDIRSHEDVGGHPTFEEQLGRGFIVGCHGNNISTAFNHPFKGRTLDKEEAEAVMIKAGILYSKPLVFKELKRLKVRRLLNRLPFRDSLKKLYHSLPTKYHKI